MSDTNRLLQLMAVSLIMTIASAPVQADGPPDQPLHVFCGTGDNLWNPRVEPLDSPEAVEAMFEWMSETYGASRIYWRGSQGHIWDRHYKVGDAKPLQYDWNTGWKHYLYDKLKLNEAAVAAAHKHGMEFFAYSGLFEHGVQPDVGIICPYPFEDRLRIEHPEWCPVDRWGQRRCPGPICFAYPEARRALVDRYVDYLVEQGCDGINFYTYVENVGIRYRDEFGFNEPIVVEFNKLHPDVDLRRDTLTEEQKLDWYRCRGSFVTQFIRELHTALSAKDKRLSMILDCEQPDYVQPWWGKDYPGTGMIHLDWEAWIEEGIVDELWVQLGPTAAQTALLDRLLVACEGSGVKLTVRAINPYDAVWDKYVDAGVTPVAVITWARNGIERLSLEPTSADTLASGDWRLRAQTLQDVADGKLEIPVAAVLPLADDPQVLVRHRAMRALGKLGDAEAIERGLRDEQSCVRIAAALALGEAGSADNVPALLDAVAAGGRFQFKLACVEAFEAIGNDAVPTLIEGLKNPSPAVREVCARALYTLGRDGDAGAVYPALREALLTDGDPVLRYWAIYGLTGLRLKVDDTQARAVAADLRALLEHETSVMVRLQAAWGLGYLAAVLDGADRQASLATLVAMFRDYGDSCELADAAYGWRMVGNALLVVAPEGHDALERMRAQTDDRWLAWIAYEVKYAPQRSGRMKLIDEAEAVRIHEQYAPEFPGLRSW